MLWLKFATVFAGTRQMTMSAGLRDLYLADREMSDEDVCALEHGIDPAELIKSTGETVVGTLRRGVWVRLVKAGVLAELLDHVEAGGWPAALAFLRSRRLALEEPPWRTLNGAG